MWRTNQLRRKQAIRQLTQTVLKGPQTAAPPESLLNACLSGMNRTRDVDARIYTTWSKAYGYCAAQNT